MYQQIHNFLSNVIFHEGRRPMLKCNGTRGIMNLEVNKCYIEQQNLGYFVISCLARLESGPLDYISLPSSQMSGAK